jgi:FlaA1/EpsC-like NDP-sugar epimerase
MVRNDDSGYFPVALLDDDKTKRRLHIDGVRVQGTREDMTTVARRFGATALVVALPQADAGLLRDLSDRAGAAGLDVLTLPPLRDIMTGHPTSHDLRDINLHDLLGRRAISLDTTVIAEQIAGQSVLVTGAGGSIGSELCRQIARFKPAELLMVDRDESALHSVQLSIKGRALLDTPDLVLLDIRDRDRVLQLFVERRPQVVFHAAALKHLPLLEAHPVEGFKTNVWGSLAVLEAAQAAEVECFVNISTDKAADPCSILGYSKRVAEGLTAGLDDQAVGRYLSVRFGNVLGSRGSFLTAFQKQLELGGPLTVTHPDVTRFFMTVEEAVQLVLQAGAIGQGGQVLVLDMGEPVNIAEVAEQLAQSVKPPCPIEFVGLRRGEKLHEELFGVAESPTRTAHPLIRSVGVPALDGDCVRHFPTTITPERSARVLVDLCNGMRHELDGTDPDPIPYDWRAVAGG